MGFNGIVRGCVFNVKMVRVMNCVDIDIYYDWLVVSMFGYDFLDIMDLVIYIFFNCIGKVWMLVIFFKY